MKDMYDQAKGFVEKLEEAQTPADDEVVGKVALVIARVAPGRTGEVRLLVRGGSEDYLAIGDGDEIIEPNTSVTILALQAPRTVVVAPIPK